eukprot:2725351-Rhodomonas_salina.2
MHARGSSAASHHAHPGPRYRKTPLPARAGTDLERTLVPDVFLSYHWGQQYEQNGRTLYRTQEIVRKLRQPIEVATY